MNNFIEKVFKTQYDFTNKFFKEKYNTTIENLKPEERKKWIKEFILSGGKEFYECLDELNWKEHTSLGYEGNNFLEEGIDTFKFLINTLILKGVTPEEFEKKFHEKSYIVNFRYEQEKAMKQIISEDRQLAFFDIDGVLNKYPQEFLRFVEFEMGTKFTHIKQLMSENHSLYKAMKHKYRVTGLEAGAADAVDETRQLLKKLWLQGISIILLTARPYRAYNNMFFETVRWLGENQMTFDLLFFNREKIKFALNFFHTKNLRLFVDDDIENVNRVCGHVKNTFLLKNLTLHNEEDYKHVNANVKIIDNIVEIYEKSNISFL